MNSKKKIKQRILLIYDYFYPATLAGGPIVSCANLVEYLHDDHEFYIFTTNRDLDKSTLPVDSNKWLPYKKVAKIFYGSGVLRVFRYVSLVKNVKPDVIYINGIYSFFYVILPLFFSAFLVSKPKIVIAPRGMLQAGSLNVKRLKKQIYFIVFRRLVSANSVQWQVTSEHEREDLLTFIGKNNSDKITLIGNVPSSVAVVMREKSQTVLSLLTIALISPMKNILNTINALKTVSGNVVYTVYGAISDKSYWAKCLKAAAELPQSIAFHYGGVAARKDIPSILSNHDVYIQPSKSENFSHSIYEALMSGMPVITSHNTPWRVGSAGAGWNVDGNDPGDISRSLSEVVKLNDSEYRLMRHKARDLGKEYLLQANLREGYRRLFALNL